MKPVPVTPRSKVPQSAPIRSSFINMLWGTVVIVVCFCLFCFFVCFFLFAHLSRRLTSELIGWKSSRRPSVRLSVCVLTLSNMKVTHFYILFMNISAISRPIATNILSKASLGRGKDCIRFWARSDQKPGFHGNR